jgi:hypothetical protein
LRKGGIASTGTTTAWRIAAMRRRRSGGPPQSVETRRATGKMRTLALFREPPHPLPFTPSAGRLTSPRPAGTRPAPIRQSPSASSPRSSALELRQIPCSSRRRFQKGSREDCTVDPWDRRRSFRDWEWKGWRPPRIGSGSNQCSNPKKKAGPRTRRRPPGH